jgi:hypothetical protein
MEGYFPAVLLIIFGAGASFDCLSRRVLDRIDPGAQDEWRPPLASGLLSERHSFEQVLEGLPQCAALVANLQELIAAGANIERELETLQEGAAAYPPRYRELMAFRFYLRETLWRSSLNWTRLSAGKTLFADLFRRVDIWRHAADETVCVATFNYDLLIDHALAGQVGMELSHASDYVSDRRYHYAKLHGSVNWARKVAAPDETTTATADHARAAIIDSAASFAESQGDHFVRRFDDPLSESGFLYIPAIAIPTDTKKNFECPPSQLSVIQTDIPQVDRILVVGWRGAEMHFLEKLRHLKGMATPVLLVGHTENGCEETTANLTSIGLSSNSIGWSATGFSAFMQTTGLETFLDSSVGDLRAYFEKDRYALGVARSA